MFHLLACVLQIFHVAGRRRKTHGCTLFDFLSESRGSYRGTSVGVATVYRGHPRISTARARAFRCTWRFHVKCHGCGHSTCPGSVRGNNPRKYHGNCHGIFYGHLHVNCRGHPRQSTANVTAILPRQLPRQSSHGNCHGHPPTASAMAIRGNCHGTPQQLPRQMFTGSNLRQYLRQTTAFYSDFHIILRGNCHCNYHGKKT